MDTKGAFTIAEFCRWAGISRSKFYLEAKAGRIPLLKLG